MSKRYEKYELVRDLPDADAGTILEWDGDDHYDYKSKRCFDDDTTLSWYRKEFVENNPSWFKPIEDKEPTAFQPDKNFLVLLKAFVERKMKEAGYNTMSEKFERMIDTFHEAKEYLFNRKSDSIPAGTGTANDVWPTSKKFQESVKEAFEENFKEHGVQPYPNPANDVLNERDWEIVSLKADNGTLITHRGNIDFWISDNWPLKYKTTIHSVKRLLDNEVFSVGDKIDVITFSHYKNETIKEFEIIGSLMMANIDKYKERHGFKLSDIKLSKPTDNDVSNEGMREPPTYRISPNANKIFEDTLKELYPTLDRQDKKERIIVDLISNDKEKFNGKWGNVIKIWYPYTPQYAKWSSIKKAIEQILNDEEKKIIHCGNCGQYVSLHEPPHFKCPSIPTLERWDLKWEEGKAVLQKSPTGKWLLFEYPKSKTIL